MKKLSLLILCVLIIPVSLIAGNNPTNTDQKKEMISLVEKYALARENKDAVLLKSILIKEVSQLVSSGEWRNGTEQVMEGMMKSSNSKPATRTIKPETVRVLNQDCGIVDARYEIHYDDGTERKMWSTFIVVLRDGSWKIAAIRNMLIPKS